MGAITVGAVGRREVETVHFVVASAHGIVDGGLLGTLHILKALSLEHGAGEEHYLGVGIMAAQGDQKLLEASTELLVKYAGPIINYRAMFVKDINDILIKITRALTGVKDKIEIHYRPFVNMSSDYQNVALEAFNRALESDLRHKATSIGIHREDISVSLNGKDIGTFGSQGENRLVALALKLSPYFLITDKDKKPIIVLDDVMSELDKNHREQLIKFLRKFEQVFITDTKLEIDGATRIELNNAKEVF